MSGDGRIGTEVAGYRVDSLIGRGGMGVVYLAEHLRLKRKVALKVLAPELASDERFRERFVIESELAASLEHPNIVPIYDAGEADGLLYIAMRFIEGTDLKALIERGGALPLERTAHLVGQVASALDAAHGKGLIHRDVKPANVLLGQEDHAYLTDFGLTKRPYQTTGLTKTGQFMGSVDYAAPEQFEGKALDARTDVYSLACVAYECLTGEVPFRREQEAAVMYAHLRSPPPRVSAIRKELPAAIDPVLARGMAKKPADRFPTAGGFASALREPLSNGPSETPPPPRRRPRRLLAGAAVVTVVAVVIAAIVVASGHSTPRPAATTGPAPAGTGTAPGASFVGVTLLDPTTSKQAMIPISLGTSEGPNSKAITTGDGFVWVVDTPNYARSTLYKISPQTDQVINTLSLRYRVGVAFGGGLIWTPTYSILGQGPVLGVDPNTVSVSAHVDVPQSKSAVQGNVAPCCVAIAYGEGSLWALGSDHVYRIDPEKHKIEKLIPVAGTGIAVGGGKVWVLDSVLGRLFPVDPATDEVGGPIALSGDPVAVAASAEAVWVVNKDGTVDRRLLNGSSGIDTVKVGVRPNGIVASADGSLWVACYGDGTVWRIDPVGLQKQRFQVGGHPTQVTVDDNGVWVVMESASPAFG